MSTKIEVYPASFLSRLGASLLDGLLISLTVLTISILLSWDRNWVEGIFEVLYVTLLPLFWYGYTVGKRALNIRIVQKDGSPIRWYHALLRTIGSLLYSAPLLISMLVAFQNEEEALSTLLQFENGEFPFPLLVGLFLMAALLLTSACMVAFRSDKRALHDFFAGTCVTYAR